MDALDAAEKKFIVNNDVKLENIKICILDQIMLEYNYNDKLFKLDNMTVSF